MTILTHLMRERGERDINGVFTVKSWCGLRVSPYRIANVANNPPSGTCPECLAARVQHALEVAIVESWVTPLLETIRGIDHVIDAVGRKLKEP